MSAGFRAADCGYRGLCIFGVLYKNPYEEEKGRQGIPVSGLDCGGEENRRDRPSDWRTCATDFAIDSGRGAVEEKPLDTLPEVCGDLQSAADAIGYFCEYGAV